MAAAHRDTAFAPLDLGSYKHAKLKERCSAWTSRDVSMTASPDLSVVRRRRQASAANRLIGEVVQSRRRPLLGPSPG